MVMTTRIVTIVCVMLLGDAGRAGAAPVSFVCRAENDLYRAVIAGDSKAVRFDDTSEAMAQALEGSSVLKSNSVEY